MIAMNALTKSTAISDRVHSTDTDTGHVSWAPVFSINPFMVGFVGFSAVTYIFDNRFFDRFADFLALSDFTFLTLPMMSILFGFLGNSFDAHIIKERINDKFPTTDKKIFDKAKKKIGPRLKLAMLSHRPVENIILSSESDKYKMTHTKAELVRRNGSYFIEIETMNALAAWDLALESVVPEKVREEISHAAIARDAKYFADKIREEGLMEEMRKHEAWIRKREMWIREQEKENDLIYQHQVGTIVEDDDYLLHADYDEYDNI